jgi:FtsZ-binding cell division protein ZapB
MDTTQVQLQESLPNEGGAASSNEEVSSLIAVSNQHEAVRLNGQCTIQLIESLVDMVSNLTKEVTHLKEDNSLLKQELRNLHQVIETSPRLPPEYIAKEQRILPAEVSRKGASSVVRVPTAALSTEALSAAPIPAATALTELSCRDVAAAGISPLWLCPST